MEEIKIKGEFITLQKFLKWSGAVHSGGNAKEIISQGIVSINGEEETRRGRKLYPDDLVAIRDGLIYKVVSGED